MSKLWQELGKKKPFDSLEEETYVALQRTSSLLATGVGRLLKGCGLSDTTYNILRILRGAGEDGRTCSEIGRQVVTLVPDVTRLVDSLEKRGLAERQRGQADRRVVRVRITAAGLKLLAQMDTPLRKRHEEAFGKMSKGELRAVNELLEKMREGMI